MTLDNGCFVVRPGSHLRGPSTGTASGGGCVPPSQCQHRQGAAELGGSGKCHLLQQGQLEQEQQEQRQAVQQQQATQQQEQDAQWPPDALPLVTPAGTAVITSDTVQHCSGPNLSQHIRRAWMPQFSSGPLLWTSGGCVSIAVPLAPPPGAAPEAS